MATASRLRTLQIVGGDLCLERRDAVRRGRRLGDTRELQHAGQLERCNDFFCSLTRRADRDADCSPPATGGDLPVDRPGWRGVYEERVGTCPDGWFPDTYLLFTWSKTPQQIILRYELAPRRSNDRTVLRIDEGYIQVDRVGPCYEVSTVKYLLFDDRYLNGGGQTLAQSACQLGWLDYSVNQFTACARGLGATGSGGGSRRGADRAEGDEQLDPGMRHVLDECQGHIVESVTETDAQVRRIVSRIRAGHYGADDWVTDMSELTARAIRDGARSILGYRDLLLSVDKLARSSPGRAQLVGNPCLPGNRDLPRVGTQSRERAGGATGGHAPVAPVGGGRAGRRHGPAVDRRPAAVRRGGGERARLRALRPSRTDHRSGAALRRAGRRTRSALRRTASDNLALLSLSGRFGSADAKRAVRVYVGPAAAASALQVVGPGRRAEGVPHPGARESTSTRRPSPPTAS